MARARKEDRHRVFEVSHGRRPGNGRLQATRVGAGHRQGSDQREQPPGVGMVGHPDRHGVALVVPHPFRKVHQASGDERQRSGPMAGHQFLDNRSHFDKRPEIIQGVAQQADRLVAGPSFQVEESLHRTSLEGIDRQPVDGVGRHANDLTTTYGGNGFFEMHPGRFPHATDFCNPVGLDAAAPAFAAHQDARTPGEVRPHLDVEIRTKQVESPLRLSFADLTE